MTSRPTVAALAAQILAAFDDELRSRLATHGHRDVRARHAAVLDHTDPEATRATEIAARSGVHEARSERHVRATAMKKTRAH